MMRITTNTTLRTYQNGLYKSTNRLYSSMSKLMTQRNFDSYAADPAGATRAFKIHSSLNATRAQAANNETVHSKFQTAWSIEQEISDAVKELGQNPALSGLNGTNFTVLDSYAQVLRAGADSIVQSLNGKYDDAFIFNGAETGEAPFAIVNNQLTFRGWKVNVPDNGEEYLDPEGNPVQKDGGGTYTNHDVLEELKSIAGENLWVDIGIGFQLDANGEVMASTAYDSALSGLDFLGYGQDADGDPKDVVSIMLEIADIYDAAIENPESWKNGGQEDATRLVRKFTDAQEHMISENTSLDAEANYLETNQSRLTDTFDALNTERGSIEDIDQVDAINQLVWAQTCYNAALQVGSSVIPQSLMDYMK